MSCIEVIQAYSWTWGANNASYGGLIGRVTHCRAGDTEFWTRENVNGIDSFLISSGERQGDKRGAIPRRSRQVLELHVPQLDQWEFIADLVRQADTLRRPVIRNKTFNQEWVQRLVASS